MVEYIPRQWATDHPPTRAPTMIVAIIAAVALAQTPKIEVDVDPVDRKRSTNLRLGTIAGYSEGRLELVLHHFGGVGERRAVPPSAQISLHFIAAGKNWEFLKFREVVIADGGKSIDLGEPKHDGTVRDQGGVLEQLFVSMTLKDLERLAGQPTLKGKVGGVIFELNDTQQRWLKKYVSRLKVSEFDYLQAEREHDEPLRSEWAEDRKQAIDDAKKGSKNLYQRNLQRNLGRAEVAFRQKHGLSREEFQEIMDGR